MAGPRPCPDWVLFFSNAAFPLLHRAAERALDGASSSCGAQGAPSRPSLRCSRQGGGGRRRFCFGCGWQVDGRREDEPLGVGTDIWKGQSRETQEKADGQDAKRPDTGQLHLACRSVMYGGAKKHIKTALPSPHFKHPSPAASRRQSRLFFKILPSAPNGLNRHLARKLAHHPPPSVTHPSARFTRSDRPTLRHPRSLRMEKSPRQFLNPAFRFPESLYLIF